MHRARAARARCRQGCGRALRCGPTWATSLPLASAENDRIGPWALYAIGEINAKYITDGSSQLLASPGLQLMTSRVALEVGVQLPIHQDRKFPRLETDFTIVLSVRTVF